MSSDKKEEQELSEYAWCIRRYEDDHTFKYDLPVGRCTEFGMRCRICIAGDKNSKESEDPRRR